MYYNDIVLYCVLFTFTFAFFSCRRCSSFNSTTLNTQSDRASRTGDIGALEPEEQQVEVVPE